MKTKKLVMSALISALVCVFTIIIKVPCPLGYLNAGDVFVLIASWFLPCGYAAFSAGIGSFFADIILGYTAYAPATFVIKMLMAYVSYTVMHRLCDKKIKGYILSGALAEGVMVLGYYLYEGIFLYGFGASLVNIPLNVLQGIVGLVTALAVNKIFIKYKLI